MSNISQFFKGDTRKKNRKIFIGPSSNVTWTAPPNTSEIDVHVWGGGGHGGGQQSNNAFRQGGGGGGYTSNTFVVIGGSTVVVSVGATAGTSTAVITNPVGVSTLTSTGGTPGYPGEPAPNRGNGGSGSHTLHPAEPTAYVFTANGGDGRTSLPANAPSSVQGGSYPSGGGGAGFIYGPGGHGGQIPKSVYPSPIFPSNYKTHSGTGGGGIRGNGGFGRAYEPPTNSGVGGGGGGFMDGGQAGTQTVEGQLALGGAGLDGQKMSNGMDDTMLSVDSWFYLEDIQGYGGSSGSTWVFNSPSPGSYPEVHYARPGLAGGGGGGAPSDDNPTALNRVIGGGDGGIFGGGGGGSDNSWGGRGGFAGGGGGGRYVNSTDHIGGSNFSGAGGMGIIIIYY
jgi:hypothetical protein|tara:strand:- start:275 stop:1456 length:1182 start_codon:yes stop_codon:yes gene_type:complete